MSKFDNFDKFYTTIRERMPSRDTRNKKILLILHSECFKEVVLGSPLALPGVEFVENGEFQMILLDR
jgi:hypothetical protein